MNSEANPYLVLISLITLAIAAYLILKSKRI